MLKSASLDTALTPWFPTFGSLVSVVLSFSALRLVESCGRKNLFINTLALCAASILLMSIFSILSPILGGKLLVKNLFYKFIKFDTLC